MTFTNFLLYGINKVRCPRLLQFSTQQSTSIGAGAVSLRSLLIPRYYSLNVTQNINSGKSYSNKMTQIKMTSVQNVFPRSYSSGGPAAGGPGIGPQFNNQRIAAKFRQLDGLASQYDLIYRLNFTYPIISIQVLNIFGILIVTLVMLTLLFKVHEDEDAKSKPSEPEKLNTQIPFLNNERPVISEDAPDYIKRTIGRSQNTLPTPKPEEMLQLTWDQLAVLYVGLFGLMVALIRLQRMVPIRLYCSHSGHGYAVFYGHIIPSRTTKREFAAGTIKRLERQSPLFASDSIFVDPSGKRMVLLDYCFRNPSDMNFIMGIKDKPYDAGDDDDGNKKLH